MNRLYLFDIDGTIIRINGCGMKAFSLSANKLFGTLPSIKSLKGSTDLHVFTDVFNRTGLPVTSFDTYWESFRRAFNQTLQTLAAKQIWEILPGFQLFYSEIRNMPYGFCTGNTEAGAAIKMKAAGLPFSPRGAFGDKLHTKDDLARSALETMSLVNLATFGQVIYFGDTPEDMRAGKGIDAWTIGVTGGHSSRAELSAHGADAVITDFTEVFSALPFDFRGEALDKKKHVPR